MLPDRLRAALRDPSARSFQLLGDDVLALTGADLRAAAAAYEAALEPLPAELRPRFEAEQAAAAAEAHTFVRAHNTSIHGRIGGYLELARRTAFELPWPIVAVLGLCQVLEGIVRYKVYGIAGELAGSAGYTRLRRLTASVDDVLLRTNRLIFADSAPAVLYAVRATGLRRGGDPALADALLEGPLPPTMDEGSRALVCALAAAFEQRDGAARFAALSQLTLAQFEREQAVFTSQMGRSLSPPSGRGPLARLLALRAIQAPVIVPGSGKGRGARALVFRPYRLPEGFDMADHPLRVREFGRAFVTAVTGSVADYLTAAAYVVRRFAPHRHAPEHAFEVAGTPIQF